ncbi:alpha-keto acid decarboxylase family protein [Carnobacterium gallinarum]|uniref:alpha-keto acid decarboxylase family protein n=1 Tax=Carnobacterium gallinarum TaxID=2749 RepID=UPI0005547FD1|nr:alpha-keto acid decarboxylase family protein [Carnobacterium gallinarum]
MYTVADYLLDRLKELGINDIFGVPGDYNLKFLDHITARDDLKWIGNANELNAAYMADGYARTKGMAALVTTFGVGELSAMNGIGGSFAEKVPVIEIVGSPTTAVQNAQKLVHHTLGDGRFNHFEKMHEAITVGIGSLTKENAITEIDRILGLASEKRQPGYLNLPIDVAEMEVEKPNKPLFDTKVMEIKMEQELIKSIEKVLNSVKHPVIIAGNEIASFHLEAKLAEFIEKFNLPVTTLPFGKGVFNEEDKHYLGVYTGTPTTEPLKSYVDQADLVLLLGAKLTDSATSGFSQGFTEKQMISLASDEVIFQGEHLAGIQLPTVLDELLMINYPGYHGEIQPMSRLAEVKSSSSLVTQAYFWEAVESYLEEGDTLVAEQGTSFFGASTVPMKKGMSFIGQPLWGSIGYTFPAMLGSQIAKKGSRHLLFIGDGSLQLTVQELGMTLREKLAPIVFIINNNGYTVEREIHGPEEIYNDIPMWDYQKLPSVFGGTAENVVTYKVQTEAELATAMRKARLDSKRLQWIEVVMNQKDAPDLLVQMGKIFAKQNS